MIFFVWLITYAWQTLHLSGSLQTISYFDRYHIQEIWPNSPRKCLTTAKNKKGVFIDRYTAGICNKFWYMVGIWQFWYKNGMWKSREWLFWKILVYKPVYVEIWYVSGMWTKKSRIKSYTDLFFLLWGSLIQHHNGLHQRSQWLINCVLARSYCKGNWGCCLSRRSLLLLCLDEIIKFWSWAMRLAMVSCCCKICIAMF